MLRVATLLAVLSALCTVAVAWACALWSPLEEQPGRQPPPHLSALVPVGWLRTTYGQGTVLVFYFEYAGVGTSLQEVGTTDQPHSAHGIVFRPGRMMYRVRCGWPLACLEGLGRVENQPPPSLQSARSAPAWVRRRPLPGMGVRAQSMEVMLPTGPLISGLVANASIYFAALYAPVLLIAWARRAVRLRSGRCRACNYDLSATPSGPCPECGAAAPLKDGPR